jgi:hypothetical protein
MSPIEILPVLLFLANSWLFTKSQQIFSSPLLRKLLN